MTCAQGLLRLLWGGGGPEVGVLRDCFCSRITCSLLYIKSSVKNTSIKENKDQERLSYLLGEVTVL